VRRFEFARSGARVARIGAALVVCALLSACAAPPPVPLNDPYEVQNRRVHTFNKTFDTALLRPVSGVFGAGGGGVVSESLSNAAGNLRLPRAVANTLLQARFADAVHNTARFSINSTIGLLGLIDVAGAMGLDERPADFGQTLHAWGVGEGVYMELPLIGPTTERDTVGIIVDVLIDPVGIVLPAPESYYARGVNVVSKVGDRARFRDTIDSILYESADSYAQTRLLYLQNRRFQLGQETSDEEFFDPYAD